MSEPQQLGRDGQIRVGYDGNIAIIIMDCGENKINQLFFDRLNTALDEVERNKDVHALITTGNGNFYCNGVDIAWFGYMQGAHPDVIPDIAYSLHALCARLLTFPMPTIAAVNGHAFGGGAVLSLLHDYTVMNSERGWWSLNEVHIGLRLHPFSNELIRNKVFSAFHQDITAGARFTGHEAKIAGIASHLASPSQLITVAKAVATDSLKQGHFKRQSMKNMKEDIYANVIAKQYRYNGRVPGSSKL